MSAKTDVATFHGSFERESNKPYRVSFYDITEENEVGAPKAKIAYFPAENDAVGFVQRYRYPPEMAHHMAMAKKG